MAHARTQIRSAFVSAVTGLATTGTNVYEWRAHSVESTKLPALVVSTREETVEHDTIGTPGDGGRMLTIECLVYARGATAYDTADQACAEVEAAIAADETLGGLCKSCRLQVTATEADAEPEALTVECLMEYSALYRVANDDPETIIS